MSPKAWNRIILSSIIVITAIYFFYALFFGIGTFADALRGFEVLRQFQQGGDWNTLSYPDVHGDFSFFVAWWSPGQWMIPAFFIQLLGNNIQIIQLVLVVLCTFLGLFFYYKLFIRLNFSKNSSLLALLLIVSNQLFYWHYFLYYGGDLFVFAFLPIYLISIINFGLSFSIKNIILFGILSTLGLFFKNTFLIFIVASAFLLFFHNKLYLKSNWKLLLGLSLTTIFILGLFYIFYLSKGETPGTTNVEGTYNQIQNTFFNDLFFSWGSPAGILTHLSAFAQKITTHFNGFRFVLITTQIITVGISFLLFRLIYRRCIYQGEKTMYFLAFYFIIPVLIAFNYFYLFDKAVSYNMRHFAPLAFVLAPALIEWIKSLKKWKNWAFISLIFLSLLDLNLFFVNTCQLKENRAYFGDFLFNKSEAKTLNLVAQWDKKHTNSIVISENYWLPLFAVQNNDKLALRLKNKQWTVASGMELEKAPKIKLEQLNLTQYNSILLLTKQDEDRLIKKMSQFSIRRKFDLNELKCYVLTKKN